MAGILSLDLSFSGTGWALMRSPDEKPVSGVWALKKGLNNNGEVFKKLQDTLCDIIELEQPSLVGIEAPRPPNMGGLSTFQTFYKLIGLCVVTELVCESMGVPKVEMCHVQTVRKHFCGSGHAKKDKVMEVCRSLGWRFIDDNAADALAILHYLCHKNKVPGYEFPPNSLFTKRK